MDNRTLAKLGRALYPRDTVIEALEHERIRLERENFMLRVGRGDMENARLRAERDDLERILAKRYEHLIA